MCIHAHPTMDDFFLTHPKNCANAFAGFVNSCMIDHTKHEHQLRYFCQLYQPSIVPNVPKVESVGFTTIGHGPDLLDQNWGEGGMGKMLCQALCTRGKRTKYGMRIVGLL